MNSLHTAEGEAAQTVMSGKPKGHLQLGSLGRIPKKAQGAKQLKFVG